MEASSSSTAASSGGNASSSSASSSSSPSSLSSQPAAPTVCLPFFREKHRAFILRSERNRDSYEYVVTEHLRMSGVYWGLSALKIIGAGHDLALVDLLAFVTACRHPCGGYSGNVGHDPHLLYTLSALQILAMCSRLPIGEEAEKTAAFVAGLQRPDGSFAGDAWGEIDSRFSYCALQCMALLGHQGSKDDGTGSSSSGTNCSSSSGSSSTATRPSSVASESSSALSPASASSSLSSDASASSASGETPFQSSSSSSSSVAAPGSKIDLEKAVLFVSRCANFDGGFGAVPGAESHAGQVFCCVGALAIARALHVIDRDTLSAWLAERQVDSGGLNGRPEKQADVCYSWWILSSLHILGRLHWIDGAALASFITACQDEEGGGIADRPGNMADIFHTYFGIAGLSLLGNLPSSWVTSGGAAEGGAETTEPIDPVYALPKSLVDRLCLPASVFPKGT